MDDDQRRVHPDPDRALIAHFKGARPPSPAWFDAALAQTPQRTIVPVEGAGVEALAWGRPEDPGLLLLHGFAANADWWSFIAPFLATGRRVVALSFSGMGGSDWRDAYSMDQHMREVLAVAEAHHLFAGGRRPLLAGHSYGSFIARLLGADHGDRLEGVVLVDGPLSRTRGDRAPRLGGGVHRVYPSFEAALARFRFVPAQTCENLYIADHIARASLKPATGPDGTEGWTWRFDGELRSKAASAPLTRLIRPLGCPSALIFGERSLLMTPQRLEFMQEITAPGTPWITVPDAGHHLMADQPLALVAALRGLLSAWPAAVSS